MKTFNRVLATFLFASIAVAQVSAEVYKRTNPDGSVEFTDVPSKQEEKPIKLSPLSTFKAPALIKPQAATPSTQANTYSYSELRITSPANETTIRENSGTIEVSVSVTPALNPDHKLVVMVDGTQESESTSGSFTFNNLDRGSHSLTAQVVDKAGKSLISATPVTIFLHRQSVIRAKRFAR